MAARTVKKKPIVKTNDLDANTALLAGSEHEHYESMQVIKERVPYDGKETNSGQT